MENLILAENDLEIIPGPVAGKRHSTMLVIKKLGGFSP